MTEPNSMPISDVSAKQDVSRTIDTPELIDRLATEMRARTGGELPHAFYVDQVKRKLSGRTVESFAANDEPARMPKAPPVQASVFHSWALSE